MNNARKTEESKEQYHIRLKAEQKELDAKRKPALFWNTLQQGTYVKSQQKAAQVKEPTTSNAS